MSRRFFFLSLLLCFTFNVTVSAQISPGKLAAVHSHLEGISNCTHCHTLGAQVSNEKCLACHKELKSRIDIIRQGKFVINLLAENPEEISESIKLVRKNSAN